MKHHRYAVSILVASLVSVVGPLRSGDAQQPTGREEAAATRPAATLEALTDEAYGTVQRRYLTAGVHSPWQIMHGVLALGYDMHLREGPDDELVGAIDFICRRASVGGRRVVQPTRHGLRFTDGYQTQGHPDQFLAILAQAGVPADAAIEIGPDRYTVDDLVKHAQAETGQHSETSWTLIALSHYRGPQAEWRNQYDQRYTVEGLLRWELDQSVESGACGGTHRLSAISRAVADYRKTGQPLHGVWQQAHEKVRRYLDRARSYQFSDGCFSNDFFQGATRTSDLEDHLHSHGHTLEWVVSAVEEDELQDGWVADAVEHLCRTLIDNQRRPVDCGSLYHAGSALRIYRQRRWPKPPATLAETNAAPEAAARE